MSSRKSARLLLVCGAVILALLTSLVALSPSAGAVSSSGAATLTLTSSASAVPTGTTVTLSGTLTSDGQPVANSAIGITATDPAGGETSLSATTDASGAWSEPLLITWITAITATSLDTPSNQASLTVNAVAKVSIQVGPSVSRPLLVDPVKVSVSPWNIAITLQVRDAGSTTWHTLSDSRGIWGTKPGQIYVRAVYQATDSFLLSYVTPAVAVRVGKGKVPAWLTELNNYRSLNNAGAVVEDPALSAADALHIRYMEKTGQYSHEENKSSRWYTAKGAQAGMSSDLYLGSTDPINGWARAPYHAISELSRTMTLAGFAQGGGFSALQTHGDSTAPIKGPFYQFPANGKTTSLRTYVGGELPVDPISLCPSAWQKREGVGNGLPIIFGNQLTPAHITASVKSGGKTLRSCVVNDGEYDKAVFIIPLLPLAKKHAYTVSVSYSGKLQSRWTFKVS